MVQNRASSQSWQKTNALMFENCVITGQFQEYILSPELSTTPVSGCFGMARTDRHTHGHCNSMTESAQWANSVKRVDT